MSIYTSVNFLTEIKGEYYYCKMPTKKLNIQYLGRFLSMRTRRPIALVYEKILTKHFNSYFSK